MGEHANQYNSARVLISELLCGSHPSTEDSSQLTTFLSTPSSTIILLAFNSRWMTSLMPLPLLLLWSLQLHWLSHLFTCHDLEGTSSETSNFNYSLSNHNLISFQLLPHHSGIHISLIKSYIYLIDSCFSSSTTIRHLHFLYYLA